MINSKLKHQISKSKFNNWLLILGIYLVIGYWLLVIGGISEAASNAIDPMYIGTGARPLGMGKAYVAVAEDADTMFINPAGLGKIEGLKLTSMYANLLGDVKYTTLGIAYPIKIGALGVGYIGSRVDDIWIMGNTISSHYPTPLGLGGSSNNVAFLSYGTKLNKFLLNRDVYLGGNLKYFIKDNSGSDAAAAGTGGGIDLDLGALYSPTDWMTVGVCTQNILPSSLGGKISYNSGYEEGIPAAVKVGTKFNVLGRERYSIVTSPVDLNLAADADFNSNREAALHLGAEFWPVKMLALRAGFDQDPVPSTVSKSFGQNLTLGMGLKLFGVQFDYAYHPYSTIGDNTTHFFSVSYVGGEKVRPKAIIIKPADRLITYENSIEVVGQVSGGVKEVEINGQSINIPKSGRFTAKVPLKIGKNLIISRAYSDTEMIMEDKRKILRLATFSDVVAGYWAKEQIEFAATAGLIEGYPDDTFRPENTLSRAEMTTLLVRIKKEKLPRFVEEKLFRDLPTNHWASRYIEAALKADLVEGYPDGSFKPDRRINRAEGVTVSTRFDGIDPGKVDVSTKPFADVNKKYWAAGAIEAAKDKGLIDYMKEDIKFLPKRGLTRAESVVIMTRTDYGSAVIEELLNWDKGYAVRSLVVEQD